MPKWDKKKFASHDEFIRDVKANYTMGLAGEVGEYVDIIKKEMYHGHPEDREKKVNELGDIMHYLAGQCTLWDITMEEVVTANIMKLSKRYVDGFSTQASIERKDVLTDGKN